MSLPESNERLKINHVDVHLRMEHQISPWQSTGDRRHIFLSCYRLMTGNILQAIEASPLQDGVWVNRARLCSKLRSLMRIVSAYSR